MRDDRVYVRRISRIPLFLLPVRRTEGSEQGYSVDESR